LPHHFPRGPFHFIPFPNSLKMGPGFRRIKQNAFGISRLSPSISQFDDLDQHLASQLRRVALFGIAISTLCTISAIVIVPMLYSYAQFIQSQLQVCQNIHPKYHHFNKLELDFCRDRTEDLVQEFIQFEGANPLPILFQKRRKRRQLSQPGMHKGSGMAGQNSQKARGTAALATKRQQN
jgi:hypothetical protein